MGNGHKVLKSFLLKTDDSDIGEARKKVLGIWRDAVFAKYKPAPKP